MATRMADDLGDAVHLGQPVLGVRHGPDGVAVETAASTVVCGSAVVAAPPALVLDIVFDPPLEDDRVALYRRAVGGTETKTLVVYDRPFWRSDGWSGQSAEPGSPAEVTIDASPASGSPGVLACFTFGPVARRFDARAAPERRDALVDALVRRFGAAAASPLEVLETAWWTEPWTRGCSMAHLPPGALTRYGPLLRRAVGRVHWAGTETAGVGHGAIEGAVRSGTRAAEEILVAGAAG